MPLTGTENALGTAIANAVVALTPEEKNNPVAIWQAVANVLLPHLVTNTTVNTPIPVQVNTGTGTGATTAPGTIS